MTESSKSKTSEIETKASESTVKLSRKYVSHGCDVYAGQIRQDRQWLWISSRFQEQRQENCIMQMKMTSTCRVVPTQCTCGIDASQRDLICRELAWSSRYVLHSKSWQKRAGLQVTYLILCICEALTDSTHELLPLIMFQIHTDKSVYMKQLV